MDMRIRALDGWRATAVTMVIAGHLLLFSSVRSEKLGQTSIVIALLGVEYFFVISGFVIGRRLLSEGRISLGGFYIRRIFRIVPPLLLYMLVVTIFNLMHWVNIDLFRFWRVITFTCNPNRGSVCTFLGGHTWSLSVEEQFYLIIPAMIAFGGRRITGLIAAIIAPIVVVLFFIKQTQIATIIQPFIFISAGIICAIYESTIRQIVAVTPQYAAIVGLVLSIFIAYLRPTGIDTAVTTIILPIAIAFTLMLSTLKRGAFETFLNSAMLQAVGRVSYGVYIWQQLATYPYLGAGWLTYALLVLAVLIMAFASYHWIERPLIDLGRKLSGRSKRASPTPIVAVTRRGA